MPDHFERFTEQARLALVRSHEEAQRRGHNAIDTQHLLLGLLRVEDGAAVHMLAEMGVEVDRIRADIDRRTEAAGADPSQGTGLTSGARRAIERTVEEAQLRSDADIGTHHLLLGLVAEGEGLAASVLSEQGVTLERAREQAEHARPESLNSPSSEPPRPPPGDRFSKFTDRARRVLTLAQEEAERLGHDYIGTEHLLLGLARQPDAVGARVLVTLGVGLEDVRARVETVLRGGPSEQRTGLRPDAKRALELAVDEARRFEHAYIGTEHLALGLVREGEGIGARVLRDLGVQLDRAREETRRVLGQATPPA